MADDLRLAEIVRDINDGRKIMFESLRRMVAKDSARITNIVRLCHDSLSLGEESIMQHVVTSSIAQWSEELYKQYGLPLEGSISIGAQDSIYTENDRNLLSSLPAPIRVDPDSKGF